jgi:hypothetical protein
MDGLTTRDGEARLLQLDASDPFPALLARAAPVIDARWGYSLGFAKDGGYWIDHLDRVYDPTPVTDAKTASFVEGTQYAFAFAMSGPTCGRSSGPRRPPNRWRGGSM